MENICDYSLKAQDYNNDITDLIEKTKDSNPKIRLNALKQMCPCKIKKDIDIFWNQIFAMVEDVDPNVRYQVLHTICDGSPKHLENKIADALEVFNRDPDQKIRRQAHKVLASYIRTGKWNIL